MSESSHKPYPQNNPYASAAGAYDQNAQKHTPDQRELEARVLLKAARQFQTIQAEWDNVTQERLEEALTYNRQIWMMFVDTAVEDKNPERNKALRNNIANLGVFIFNHTVSVMAAPQKEKLNVLIDINRDIAAGLMMKPGAAESVGTGAGTEAALPPAPAEKMDTQT